MRAEEPYLTPLPHLSAEHRQLAGYCTRWGGKLIHVSEEEYKTYERNVRGFLQAPFTGYGLGVHWGKKQVVYVDADWPSIIHEMGHVFASQNPPGPKCQEYDFFGWEIALAKKVGDLSKWELSNLDYVIGPNDDVAPCLDQWAELRDLDRQKRDLLYEVRVRFSKKIGLLNHRGRPLCIRRW